jgi:hypothetical protein
VRVRRKYRASRRDARAQVTGVFCGTSWRTFFDRGGAGRRSRGDDDAGKTNRLFAGVADVSRRLRQPYDWRYICRILRHYMIFMRHRIDLGRDAAGRSNTDGLRAAFVAGAALRGGSTLVNQDRVNG